MSIHSPWLRHAEGTAPPSARLLCLGHAGGGASSFNGWRAVLPDWLELVKVQLPGREDRRDTPPCERVEEVLPPLFAQVRALLDLPLVIYGHSMGALIAFELASELRRQQEPLPLALFISGRRAPHKPLRPAHELHTLPEMELVDRLHALGGIPPGLLGTAKRREYYLPTIRADLALSDEYAYRREPPLPFPLHTFIGEHDNLVVREDWEAWSELAGGTFTRRVLPGGHFFGKEGQAVLITSIVEGVRATLSASTPTPLRSAS
ncbi:alpha/beta fold hydrolase [Myxococcus sp. XM-1-1-1]|uniref:thioesterase II family protein n=1 Tax=Myxococcus sp. XM-1-1-1 TaxID=2874602 RepID=UPI001CBAFDDD|nr:alpha/beta fold hydrolase [Myxococcus sp. XM-1-1-1]MBZ4410790.1 alpha/beta fold hydrolase [Myxococcus sp. XM-1-1-1]